MLVIDKNQLDSAAGSVAGSLYFALRNWVEVKVVIGPRVEYKLEGILWEVPGMPSPNVYQSMSNKADWA